MRLVIDIDEYFYTRIKENEFGLFNGKVSEMIQNGTPLPKGHGRLIDADYLIKEFANRARAARNWKESALNSGNEESAIRADAVLSFLTEVKLTIDNAPTVTPDKVKKNSIYGEMKENNHGDQETT